ncbi:MAG: zf-HC2 domain-containing protein [Anaerolineae bacterium]|nr:zf-HC2 domain-containing protein [Anaerolineae bacterium]
MTQHVKAELLAYLDGELDTATRASVEAHLAQCKDCAAHLAELRTLQSGLNTTMATALTPVRLGYDADRTIRRELRAVVDRPHWWQVLWLRRGVLVQAALAFVVLVFFVAAYPALQRPATPPLQETLIFGQNRFAPGTKAALRVVVRSAETAMPLAGAEVLVTLAQASGVTERVYTGTTDRQGTADVAFTVPETLSGTVDLVVETRAVTTPDETVPTGRVVRPITIARAYKIYLGSDKPVYRPGQTIHLRAIVLDANTLRPVNGSEVAFVVLNPDGRSISLHQRELSDYGVAAADVVLADDVPAGIYTLRAMLGDTTTERTITVGNYELPAFRITFTTDRTFYAPGDSVTVTGKAAYFFGKAVANAVVIVRGYTDPDGESATVEGVAWTGMDGSFVATFDLPAGFGSSADALLGLEVEVKDETGQVAGLRDLIPVARQPIVVKAVPESGALKPGIENTIYLMTAYADGTPAATTLTVTTPVTTLVLHTDVYGLTEFRYTPATGQATIEVSAQDAKGLHTHSVLALPVEDAVQTLLLRTEKATYEVGETLRLEALLSNRAGVVYLDVLRAQQTVMALSAPAEGGRATFALDLDASLVGTLELHAYAVLPDGTLQEDTRLVVVDVPRQLQVNVRSDKARYLPGETARVSIQTALAGSDDMGLTPTQTLLGIAIVDESLYALDTLPPGFARTYFLLQDETLQRQKLTGSRENVVAALNAEEDARRAQDAAVQAAWAAVSPSEFSLRAVAKTAPSITTKAGNGLIRTLGALLCVLPVLAGWVISQGLLVTGVIGNALRRLGLAVLAILFLSPLIVAGGVLGVLAPLLGSLVFFGTLGLVVLCFIVVALHGWLRHDVRVQVVMGFLGAYLALGTLLTFLAARGLELPLALAVFTVAAFLLLVIALIMLGQGLILEGHRIAGWVTTALSLLLIILLATLSAVPALTSDMTRFLGDPGLYAGPLGWLTGCGATAVPSAETIIVTEEAIRPTQEPQAATEKATTMVEKTEEVVKTVEITSTPPKLTPTKEPVATVEAATPTSVAATPVPAIPTTPAPTATTMPVPAEPYPLRYYFPETLYWAPEVLSSRDGRYTFEAPLADTLTTWRMTALATTREGDLGAATYDIVVFKDFFAELAISDTITVGQSVTVTAVVYNYTAEFQTVSLSPLPEDWYSVPASPEPLDIPAKSAQSITFAIRPTQPGEFLLQVDLTGEAVRDAVAVKVIVVGEP